MSFKGLSDFMEFNDFVLDFGWCKGNGEFNGGLRKRYEKWSKIVGNNKKLVKNKELILGSRYSLAP